MTRENGRVPAAIMRLMVIASAVLLGLSASAAIATADADAAKRKQPKPNVVLIMSDDQRADEMRWMPKTRRLLGAHIVGEGATELIHIGQAVLNLGGTLDYFVENTFNYPTLAECYKTAAFDGINRLH